MATVVSLGNQLKEVNTSKGVSGLVKNSSPTGFQVGRKRRSCKGREKPHYLGGRGFTGR